MAAPTSGSVLIAGVQPLVAAWRLDHTFDYRVPSALEDMVKVGTLVRVPLGSRKVRGIVRTLEVSTSAEPPELEDVVGAVLPMPLAAPPLDALLDEVAERYPTPRGRVFARVVPPRVRVKVGEPPTPTAGPPPETVLEYEGGPDLVQAIAEGAGGVFSLRFAASTDRGLLVAELISACPGSTLVVVPEVHHADAVLESLTSRFSDAVRIDSSVSEPVRAAGLIAMAKGQRLGLGGRAAVLAPTRELKLIVVIDEHHPALKEDRAPRYDTRWVACTRADLSGAVCVLASSTPSMESSWEAKEGGLGKVNPTRDRDRQDSPLVQVAEAPGSGLSRELHRAIRDTLRDGRKVGILVPAAGTARTLWCASCRRSVRCSRCEAGVASESGESVCPRCKLRAPVPLVCPTCGADKLRLLGVGSEHIGTQMKKIFPRAAVTRMDPAVLARDLDRQRADADIYVTTWIGTKPQIRPSVGLVGILDADRWIRRPDFRAAERAYQALAAMAEWAGPAHQGGRLVIQTSEGDHHAVQAVVRADHDHFVAKEGEARAELGYPPFSELVKVRAFGVAGSDLIEEVRSELSSEDRMLGPIEVAASDGEPALEVLIKTSDAGRVASALRVILPRVPAGSRLRIDADPR